MHSLLNHSEVFLMTNVIFKIRNYAVNIFLNNIQVVEIKNKLFNFIIS